MPERNFANFGIRHLLGLTFAISFAAALYVASKDFVPTKILAISICTFCGGLTIYYFSDAIAKGPFRGKHISSRRLHLSQVVSAIGTTVVMISTIGILVGLFTAVWTITN